jgi:hypothetical protein
MVPFSFTFGGSKRNDQRATDSLDCLRANREGSVREINGEYWASVYLDNARPVGMSARAFAGHLSALKRAGLYREAPARRRVVAVSAA